METSVVRWMEVLRCEVESASNPKVGIIGNCSCTCGRKCLLRRHAHGACYDTELLQALGIP